MNVSTLALALIGLAASIGAGGQPPDRTEAAQSAVEENAAGGLVIREPAEGATVVGPSTVEVAPAASARLVEMTVLVDGREVCRIARAPWSCRWDAGASIVEHHVRVVGVLESGRRVVANRRTRGLDVNETVNVSAVQVPVIVTGPDGRFVTGLGVRDFAVVDDGRREAVDSVIDQTLPLEVVIAIDISGSMEPSIADVGQAVRRLLARLRPADTATVVGFNDTIFLLAEREGDPALRDAAIEGLVPWGGTALYDATVKAVDLVSQHAGRRGVILFSDGDDRHSVGRRDESLRRIEEAQVAVYTVGFGDGGSEQFRRTLAAFAEASGARAFFPRRPQDLDETFDRIFQELSHQYILSYVPSGERRPGWRTLEVHAACAGCRVRAREGYRAAEQ